MKQTIILSVVSFTHPFRFQENGIHPLNMNRVLEVLPIEEQDGQGDTPIIERLTGFLEEQKWDIIENKPQKSGRKRKLNVPSGRSILVGT